MNHASNEIINNIKNLTDEEIEELYGIQIDHMTGKVFDILEQITFKNIALWSTYIETQDNSSTSIKQKIGSKPKFDDTQ